MYTSSREALLKPFFEIFTFEQLNENPDIMDDDPHTLPFIEMIWMTNGSGRLKIDMRSYMLDAGRMFCIMPGQLRQLTMEPGCHGCLIRFNELFLQMERQSFNTICHEGLMQVLAQQVHLVQEQSRHEMLDIIRKLIHEHENRHMYSDDLLIRYLNILIIYLARQSPQQQDTNAPYQQQRLVKQFTRLVDRLYKTNKRVSEYAELIRVTPNYLSQAVKEATGYPAQYHIMQRVALEARRYATYSDSSMKEVAWDLGFTDMAHFSRFFKKVTGDTFSTFKRKQERMAALPAEA
jgi:AraC-like DNA-binding protein